MGLWSNISKPFGNRAHGAMVGIQGLFFTWFSFLPIPYVFAACGRLDRNRYACCDRFLDSFRSGGSPQIRFGLPCCGGPPHPFSYVDVVPPCQRDHVYDGNQSLLLRPKYPNAANFSSLTAVHVLPATFPDVGDSREKRRGLRSSRCLDASGACDYLSCW